MIEFTVPGNPKALKRHRTFKRGKFAGQYDPSSGDKADFLAKAMQYKPDKPFDHETAVDLTFVFPRPKSHYRTGKFAGVLRDDAPVWHTKTPDADNLAKFVCDALNGIFWKDDKVICFLMVSKFYSEKPGVKIKITKAAGGK